MITQCVFFQKQTFNDIEKFSIIKKFIHFKPEEIYIDNVTKNDVKFSESLLEKIKSANNPDEISLYGRRGEVAKCSETLLIVDHGDSQMISFDYTSLPSLDKYIELYAHERFLAAYVFDTDFDIWQNETHISNFKLWEKDYKHLPTKRNSLFGEKLIDTSNNPGRFDVIEGIEVRASWCMIFGKYFFKYVAKDKLLRFPYAFEVKEIANDVIFIRLFENISDTESLENLRKHMQFRQWIEVDRIISEHS
jgi:hypothetical protein